MPRVPTKTVVEQYFVGEVLEFESNDTFYVFPKSDQWCSQKAINLYFYGFNFIANALSILDVTDDENILKLKVMELKPI